ncbi:MAG: flagellin [Spirochaetes bacterium]|nr:flagellin [Spirochaetota bacterium]
MIINHNLSSLFANRQVKFRNWEIQKNIEKLSSGERINKAGDDASGLAVSEKMRSQIRGLRQAERNIQSAVSFMQTAEGYLAETTEILQRARELAIQASNGIYTEDDRAQIQLEIAQLVDEIDRIASHAQFNGYNILTGRFAAEPTTSQTNSIQQPVFFHVGPNMDQREYVTIGTMTAAGLGIISSTGETISVSTADKANLSIGVIDNALRKVTTQRAKLGAYQNRFEQALSGVSIAAENLTAAESQIRDTNMAEIISEFTKNQIIIQAGTSMLAQANNIPALVLRLLG